MTIHLEEKAGDVRCTTQAACHRQTALRESTMKLGDIDWSKINKRHVYLVQLKLNGDVFTCEKSWFDKYRDESILLAKRHYYDAD